MTRLRRFWAWLTYGPPILDYNDPSDNDAYRDMEET